jgi:hypothetical protein
LAVLGGAPVGAGTRTGDGVRGLGVGVTDAGGVTVPDPREAEADEAGVLLVRVVGIGRPQPAIVATRVVATTAAASTRLTSKGPALLTTIGSEQQS